MKELQAWGSCLGGGGEGGGGLGLGGGGASSPGWVNVVDCVPRTGRSVAGPQRAKHAALGAGHCGLLQAPGDVCGLSRLSHGLLGQVCRPPWTLRSPGRLPGRPAAAPAARAEPPQTGAWLWAGLTASLRASSGRCRGQMPRNKSLPAGASSQSCTAKAWLVSCGRGSQGQARDHADLRGAAERDGPPLGPQQAGLAALQGRTRWTDRSLWSICHGLGPALRS